MFDTALWASLAACLYMTGVIWFVHLVHYPLMTLVHPDQWPEYHGQHTTRTGWVVMAPMLIELATAITLFATTQNRNWPIWLQLALALALWLMTFTIQVPQHTRLAKGFDPSLIRQLASGNLYRALAWTARSAVLLFIAFSHYARTKAT